MAAYIKTLQDATTGDYIYPRTKPEAIIDDDGESLSETINNLKALAETMTEENQAWEV